MNIYYYWSLRAYVVCVIMSIASKRNFREHEPFLEFKNRPPKDSRKYSNRIFVYQSQKLHTSLCSVLPRFQSGVESRLIFSLPYCQTIPPHRIRSNDDVFRHIVSYCIIFPNIVHITSRQNKIE